MKILFFIHNLEKGGAERVLQSLSGYFAQKGDKCDIVYFDKNGGYYKFDDRVEITKLKREKKSSFLMDKISHIFAIRKEIKEKKPDLIISFMDYTNFDVILANTFLKSKLIITEHVEHSLMQSKKHQEIRKTLYSMADVLTVLSKDDYNYYRKFVKKCVIMPNPVSFNYEKNYMKENIILNVARLEEIKGHENFFKSLKLVDPMLLAKYRVLIVGDGSQREKLEQMARDFGLNVEFLGHVNNIEELYSRAKIVAVSSLSEGFCNVLVESIFFDVARISTKTVGAKELIEDGETGLLCNVGDNQAFAQKLTFLMKNETFREKIISNARKQKDNYSIETIGKKWDELIEKVVKK